MDVPTVVLSPFPIYRRNCPKSYDCRVFGGKEEAGKCFCPQSSISSYWWVTLVSLPVLLLETDLILLKSVEGRVCRLCARRIGPVLPEAGSSFVQHRDKGSSRLLRCADRCRKRQAYWSRSLGGDGRHIEPVAVNTRHTGGSDVGCL